MYCFVTKKGSPCRATPYPFKCVGLHVLRGVNTYADRYRRERNKRKQGRKKKDNTEHSARTHGGVSELYRLVKKKLDPKSDP